MVLLHGWTQVVCLLSQAAAFIMVGCLVEGGCKASSVCTFRHRLARAATGNGAVQALWAALLSQNACTVPQHNHEHQRLGVLVADW